MKNKYKQYRKNSITTSNSGQILLMLYAAAIKNVRKARVALEAEAIPEKCYCILKAQDIVNELSNVLDFEAGGELAERLEGLYDYISFQLTEAHINNLVEPLDNVEKVLVTLNDGWEEAVKQMETSK